MGAPIGIIANPAAGKDIRRLVAHASVFDNPEKQNIVRRAVLGAVAAGATDFLYMDDPYSLVASAVESLGLTANVTPVETPRTGNALDTTRAAQRLAEAGCEAVITLGGDGTNRAAVKGWRDAPLLPISTGTNNVFPMMVEGTTAGMAAALVATGEVALEQAAQTAKCVRVVLDDGREDVALIDAAVLSEQFIGARAVWNPGTIRTIVLARAEPAAVGLSSIGGLLSPIGANDDRGLLLELGDGGKRVRAPIAPGLIVDIAVRAMRPLELGEPVTIEGPVVIALDGEREITLREGRTATLSVLRDGPRVIDVARTLRIAACAGTFARFATESMGEHDGH